MNKNIIRIANFVLDEKFIDSQIEYHDMTNDCCHHDYYRVTRVKREYKFIKKYSDRVISLYPQEALNVVNEYDAVFIHYLSAFPIQLIPMIPNKVVVFWFSWGNDIYGIPDGNPFVNIRLFRPLTKRYLFWNYEERKNRLVNRLKDLVKGIGSDTFKSAVNRIDYYSGVFPEEYEMMRSSNPFFKARPVDYSYCNTSSFDKVDNLNKVDRKSRKNILIGNSTAPENNHLDILETLKNVNIEGRRIYVPLSYSPSPAYVKKITNIGTRYFGDNFIPLVDFLPYDEYVKIIDSCGIGIFGFERQQGIGNIRECLMNGEKIFLYKSSVIYKHYMDLGIKVYSIEKDLKESDAFSEIEKEEYDKNKVILYKYLNKNTMLKKLTDIYAIVGK